MKAIVFTEYGSPGRLQVKDVAKPTPKDDEVLVKVHASSTNSWDWEFQSGTSFINRLLFMLFKPKPEKQILGADIAGTVEEVGKNVTRFQLGDDVFGDLWDSWGGFAERGIILNDVFLLLVSYLGRIISQQNTSPHLFVKHQK